MTDSFGAFTFWNGVHLIAEAKTAKPCFQREIKILCISDDCKIDTHL